MIINVRPKANAMASFTIQYNTMSSTRHRNEKCKEKLRTEINIISYT